MGRVLKSGAPPAVQTRFSTPAADLGADRHRPTDRPLAPRPSIKSRFRADASLRAEREGADRLRGMLTTYWVHC